MRLVRRVTVLLLWVEARRASVPIRNVRWNARRMGTTPVGTKSLVDHDDEELVTM